MFLLKSLRVKENNGYGALVSKTREQAGEGGGAWSPGHASAWEGALSHSIPPTPHYSMSVTQPLSIGAFQWLYYSFLLAFKFIFSFFSPLLKQVLLLSAQNLW